MSLLQAKHTWESVLVEIVRGLENGTITLESRAAPDAVVGKRGRGLFALLSLLVLGDVGLMVAFFLSPGTPLLVAVLAYQALPLALVIFFGIGLAKRRAASAQVAADLKEITKEVAAAVKEAEEQGVLGIAPYTRLVHLSHRLEAVEQQVQEIATR